MLLYLSTNTCINIAMAVSQVAHFNHFPKKIHPTVFKTIVRYLSQTANKGTIITPIKTCLWIAVSTPILLDFVVVTQTVNL
jgi:hypothetical protein